MAGFGAKLSPLLQGQQVDFGERSNFIYDREATWHPIRGSMHSRCIQVTANDIVKDVWIGVIFIPYL